jgi:hypothetical protein
VADLKDIVIDCHRAGPLARFWQQALDAYAIRPYDDAEIERLAALGLTPETDPTVALDGAGPTLFFQEVPEPKTAKNRLHLDLTSSGRLAEVNRLESLGATVLATFDDHTVVADPEGNEFCVCDAE